MTVDMRILANIIAAQAEKSADLDVLTFVAISSDGTFLEETRTYRQLWENGQRIAATLDERGLKQGEAFALIMQNHPEFVEAMIAASITNTVFVPIDARLRGAKLQYMLEHADCRGAICADYAAPALDELHAQLPKLEWVCLFGDEAGYKTHVDNLRVFDLKECLSASLVEIEVRATDPDAPMQMLFTSGTTGDPKAIMAPHRRFGEGAAALPAFGFKADDRPYTGLSLTHANAQLLTLGACLLMGLRGVISRKFTKSQLWPITRHYGCTIFNLLGGMTIAVYSEPRRADDFDNPVRFVISAGMPASIWEAFRARFGVEIFEFYGAAEGGLTLNPPGGPVGSIGRAPPNLEVAILDEAGNRCPAGQSGEICFRNADGSAPVVRYHKNDGASAEKTRGGWLHMGDEGHVDAGGWLYFHNRIGGGIRRNGDFINPAFVEQAIAEFEGVDDVFVYGIAQPDSAPGEKHVVAAIVAGASLANQIDALAAHCAAKLERNALPSFFQIVDQIPKTASEKPQERFLIEAFEQKRGRIIDLSGLSASTATPTIGEEHATA